MVTDAAGTGFEIKKPHKGTETNSTSSSLQNFSNLKLRNPIRRRKQVTYCIIIHCISYLELRNPIRGRKLS